MSSLRSIAPRFEVPDVGMAVSHYIDILEFQIVDVLGEPPVYATLSRDAVEIHLRIGSRRSEAYAWVEHLDQLVAELHSRAVPFSGPFSRVYGMREIVIADPWGNAITFGENLA